MGEVDIAGRALDVAESLFISYQELVDALIHNFDVQEGDIVTLMRPINSDTAITLGRLRREYEETRSSRGRGVFSAWADDWNSEEDETNIAEPFEFCECGHIGAEHRCDKFTLKTDD